MGYALWIEDDLAWAAGTYEYRAGGVAVISRTDLFRPRDFRRDRRPPPDNSQSFIGYFASLGELNEYLRKAREPRAKPTMTAPPAPS